MRECIAPNIGKRSMNVALYHWCRHMFIIQNQVDNEKDQLKGLGGNGQDRIQY